MVRQAVALMVIVVVAAFALYPARGEESSSNLDTGSLRLALEDMAARFGSMWREGPELIAELDALEDRIRQTAALEEGGNRRILRERALGNALAVFRRKALLSNPLIDFDALLVVKRSPRQMGLPQNWQGNSSLPRRGYDNEIALLPLGGDDPVLHTVYRPESDVFVGNVELHWDADKLLYSSVSDGDQWHVYELSLSEGAPLRLTPDTWEDVGYYDACYLPDERIMLCSSGGYVAVPCVYGSDHVSTLFLLDRQHAALQQVCFEQDHNWSPRMLANGRVLYHRWEYADTPHSNTRMLFHANPDGTDQRAYWGSGAYFPNSFFYARPVPGPSGYVIGIASGHHGTQRSGRLLIVAPASGDRAVDGVVQEIPGHGKVVEPLVRDRLVDGVWPQFLHPYPLDEHYHIVSARLAPDGLWGIYLVDVFDNMTLIHEINGYALLEPIPLRSRERPPVIPDRVQPDNDEAVVYMQDVYQGDGLAGVRPGSVKALRVYAYYFSHRGQGGLHGTLGIDSAWDIRRVLGEVPVEDDGSAHFVVPANTPLAVQPLDEQGRALQLMRSWFTMQPGERGSCVGCHESQSTAPPSARASAFLRAPSRIRGGWLEPTRGFSFAREVQPVLDRHCAGCHGDAPPEGMTVRPGREFPYLRGDRMIDDWSTQISGGVGPDMGGVFSRAYADLQRFVRRSGIESDMRMLSPMDFHFNVTELGQMLRKGHHNVALDEESMARLIAWVDMNTPYHGTWAETHPRQAEHAPQVAARARELRQVFAPAGPFPDLEHIPELPPFTRDFIMPVPMEAPESATPVAADWPFDAVAAAERQHTCGAVPRIIPLGEGMEIALKPIPGGQFIMGDADGHPDEQPPHAVEVAPFWMGRFEITNEQYRRFDPNHESRDESRHGYQFGRRGFFLDEPGQPVVRVSWEDAMRFCAWLSDISGLEVSLPTEAEWEWAARAGSDQAFHFGDVTTDYSAHANLADRKLIEFAQCTARDNYEKAEVIAKPNRYDDRIPRCNRFDDGGLVSVAVGGYEPNPWGLHDMHGNVREWTFSAYRPYPWRDDDGRNTPVHNGEERVTRGGSWRDRPFRSTAAHRLPYRPDQRVFNVGFRVVAREKPRP